MKLFALLVLPAVLVAADQVPTPDTPISWITSGGMIGLLGFLVVAFLQEWIVPGSRYRKSEAELAELQRFLREEAVPLLARVQDVLVRHLEDRAWDERLQRRRETKGD